MRKQKKLFDIAFKLEGLTRHASKHAAGIVISPEPVDEVLPLYVPPKMNELVSQYAMTELEAIGFLKIDLLGLKNLTLIDRVVRLVAAGTGTSIDCNHLPLDDAQTFALIGQGNTSGVFQLESDGLKEVLRKLQPDKFEDIIAVNALYRPGPLGSGMVDDFIERRHGRQEIKYLFPELAPILAETYGVIVYQEQVMKIASAIGGYSLGQSDILRRAMGKKKAEVMAEQRAIFLKNAGERGFDEKKSGELFDLMEYFAGYGFNKSHSAAYALIAYQTAYLKAHYPAEFMACLISLEATHPEKMVFYLSEARQMGLAILPPDINRSQIQFSVVKNNILFGLQGIKNVGLAALENIIAQRTADGPFLDMFDFCKRVDLRVVNKRVIESLICAGACDSLSGNRAQKFNEIAAIMDQAAVFKKDALTGQMRLFGQVLPPADQQTASVTSDHSFTLLPDWDNKERLMREKEAIGFYLSAHPLMRHEQLIKWLSATSFEAARDRALERPNEPFVAICAGLLKTSKEIVTKKGDRMAFLSFEDTHSTAEVILFPKLFAKVHQHLEEHQCFIVKGVVDITSTKQCKIKADEVISLEKMWHEPEIIKKISLKLPSIFDQSLLDRLTELLAQGIVSIEFQVPENEKLICISAQKKLNFDAHIGQSIERLGLQVELVV